MRAELTRLDVKKIVDSGGSLAGKNLYKLDLSDIDLSTVDLRFCDLRYANLKEVNLTGANLQNANLGGSDLSKSLLSKADFSRADMRWVCFRNVTSIATIYGNCKLLEAVFFDAILDDSSSVSYTHLTLPTILLV